MPVATITLNITEEQLLTLISSAPPVTKKHVLNLPRPLSYYMVSGHVNKLNDMGLKKVWELSCQGWNPTEISKALQGRLSRHSVRRIVKRIGSYKKNNHEA